MIKKSESHFNPVEVLDENNDVEVQYYQLPVRPNHSFWEPLAKFHRDKRHDYLKAAKYFKWVYNSNLRNEARDDVIDCYQMAMQEEKTKAIALYKLGAFYEHDKFFEEAIKYYQLAIEQGCTTAFYGLGNAFQRLGDFKKAKSYYKLALENGDIRGKNALYSLYMPLEFQIQSWCFPNRNVFFDKPVSDKEVKDVLTLIPPSSFTVYLRTDEICEDSITTPLFTSLLRYGVVNTENYIRSVQAPLFGQAWLDMISYFIETWFLIQQFNVELPKEVTLIILAAMLPLNYDIPALTKYSEEALVIDKINAFPGNHRHMSVKPRRFFGWIGRDHNISSTKTSKFPENETLKAIIVHAYDDGAYTLDAFKALNYVNDEGKLQESAPKPFKRVFNECLEKGLISLEKKSSLFNINLY